MKQLANRSSTHASPMITKMGGDSMTVKPTASPVDLDSDKSNKRIILFAVFAVVLGVAFAKPLIDLVRYSLNSELYSHIPLVPCISMYLVWLKRKHLPAGWSTSVRLAMIPAFVGALAIVLYWAI